MQTRVKATDKNCTAHGLHHWVTEASTLGLAPGEWPELIDTSLGNGAAFVPYGTTDSGARIYRQSCGVLRLTVFND